MSGRSVELTLWNLPITVLVQAFDETGPFPFAWRAFTTTAATSRWFFHVNFRPVNLRFCNSAPNAPDEIIDPNHVALRSASVWKLRRIA